MKEKWGVFDLRPDVAEVHVSPVWDDTHDLKLECWCRPRIEDGEAKIVIHNDGRS